MQGIAMSCLESLIDPRWDRNEKDDLKLAIDFYYELQSKIKELHPRAKQVFFRMLSYSELIPPL